MNTRTRTVNVESPVPTPPALLTALEVRALAERGAMVAATPLLGRMPAGDGHDVIVLPGFSAGDRSTQPLRELLDSLGYRSQSWGLGLNVGPTPEILDGLARLVLRVSEEGRRRVSIVGWSLGGIYGREIARAYPEAVRQVITLGSPIQMNRGDASASRPLWDALSSTHAPAAPPGPEWERPPLPVPTTAVYTRTDGIVHWKTCLESEGHLAENVEVFGSHCGLGFNPSVAFVVANRLAQADGAWRPFRAPLYLRALYPLPVSYPPRRITTN